MKTNFTLFKVTFLTFSLLAFFSIEGFSQPDYDFTKGSLFAGKDREIGAQYRYTDVKPGVDAIVTITDISAGVRVADIDANSGYKEALQPTLDIDPGTNGFLEMQIDFVKGGSFSSMVQLEIPVTCIDVDGSKGLTYEFDQITWGASAYMDYDMIGAELSINSSPGWMSCKNISGIDYPGRDTSAKQVMFTVVNAKMSSILIRVGADNSTNSSSTTRLRSIYFKKFIYNNSFLPLSNLVSFSGNRNNNQEVVLNGKLRNEHDYITVSIEKSNNGSSFSSIGIVNVTKSSLLQFTDNSKNSASAYYRLKMTDKNGKVGYSSVLFVKAVQLNSKLSVFPSIVNDNTNISFSVAKTTTAKISLYDQSGRLMTKKDITAQAGTTTVALTGLSQFSTGQYFVVVSSEGRNYTQKIQRAN
ncbi:MAG: T9SS type A sorting domain-containing protein [Chitinophagaceae bacterium]